MAASVKRNLDPQSWLISLPSYVILHPQKYYWMAVSENKMMLKVATFLI